MEPRLKLDALLRNVLRQARKAENLYFQPPSGYRLKYPCIVYSEGRIQNRHANDKVYLQHPFYTVTVIDRDPDSKLKTAVSVLPKCACDRSFISDGLYHTTFTIYI